MSIGFDVWMRAFDRRVEVQLALSLSDFEDWNFIDAYESGMTVDEAFDEWCNAHGFGEPDSWLDDVLDD